MKALRPMRLRLLRGLLKSPLHTMPVDWFMSSEVRKADLHALERSGYVAIGDGKVKLTIKGSVFTRRSYKRRNHKPQ